VLDASTCFLLLIKVPAIRNCSHPAEAVKKGGNFLIEHGCGMHSRGNVRSPTLPKGETYSFHGIVTACASG
jgi:hypothetical protein